MKKLIILLIAFIPLGLYAQHSYFKSVTVDFADMGDILLSSGDTLNYIKVNGTDTVISINGTEIPFGGSTDMAFKLNISDTAAMLAPYALLVEAILPADTAAMLTPYALLTETNLLNNDVFNVKDYGAVGDSITNDDAAFAATLAAAKLTGGHIYMPEGNYILTNTLYLDYDGVRFTGANKYLTRIIFQGDSTENAITVGLPGDAELDGAELSHIIFV